MGICLSCLGLSPKESSESDPSETSRLLNAGPSQPQNSSPARSIIYHEIPDPEQERRDRAALEAIWKSTSDKLIDISSTSAVSAEHPTTGAPDINFAQLYRDTFPRRPVPGRKHAKSKPLGPNGTLDGPPTDDQQLEQEPGQQPAPRDEQTWLRDIIMRDPDDKSWDCNTVHMIGKPLIIEFDEPAGKLEGGAVKALKEVKDKLK